MAIYSISIMIWWRFSNRQRKTIQLYKYIDKLFMFYWILYANWQSNDIKMFIEKEINARTIL